MHILHIYKYHQISFSSGTQFGRDMFRRVSQASVRITFVICHVFKPGCCSTTAQRLREPVVPPKERLWMKSKCLGTIEGNSEVKLRELAA